MSKEVTSYNDNYQTKNWQQNPRIAEFYQKIDQYNNYNKLEKMDRDRLIEMNMAHPQVAAKMNDEIALFKKQMAGTMFDMLKSEMAEYSYKLALEKIHMFLDENLDSVLEMKIKDVIDKMVREENKDS